MHSSMNTYLQNLTKSNISRTLLIATFLILFVSLHSFAATYTSFQSGDWSTLSSWKVNGNTPAVLPGVNDDVIIGTGHTITVATATSINTLNNQGNLTVNIPANATLTTQSLNNSSSTLIGNLIVST